MKYFRCLSSTNDSLFFVDCFVEDDELSVGLGYLESGLREEEILYNEDKEAVVKVVIPESFISINTSATEINIKLEVVK